MKEQRGAYTLECPGWECSREIDYDENGIPVEEREYDDSRDLVRAYEYDYEGRIVVKKVRLTDVTESDIREMVKSVLDEKLGTMPDASAQATAFFLVEKKTTDVLHEIRQKLRIKTKSPVKEPALVNLHKTASAVVCRNRREYEDRIAALAGSIIKKIAFEFACREDKCNPALQEIFVEYRIA